MVLDATVAGASADSYITVAEADAFAAVRLGRFAEKWRAAATTADNKEDALKQATSDVDAFVRLGSRYSDLQALAFPRSTDYTGTPPAETALIPRRVREATYEQAAFLLTVAPLQDDFAERRARGLFSFNEDNVSGSLASSPEFGRMAPRAEQLLRSVVVTRSAFVGSVPVRSATVAAYEDAQ